jgi:hypothetical protein
MPLTALKTNAGDGSSRAELSAVNSVLCAQQVMELFIKFVRKKWEEQAKPHWFNLPAVGGNQRKLEYL